MLLNKVKQGKEYECQQQTVSWVPVAESSFNGTYPPDYSVFSLVEAKMISKSRPVGRYFDSLVAYSN